MVRDERKSEGRKTSEEAVIVVHRRDHSARAGEAEVRHGCRGRKAALGDRQLGKIKEEERQRYPLGNGFVSCSHSLGR